jgi:hypothetical protein
MNSELYDKMKKMSAEDLIDYDSAAKNTATFLNLLGIGILFGMMTLDGIVLLICGSILVYFAAHLSVAISETRAIIKDLLSKIPKT